MKADLEKLHRLRFGGFTLIELLVTVSIIMILAGITVGGLNFVSDKQATEKAKVQIALLSNGIEEYKLDNGDYPGPARINPTNNGGRTNLLFRALYWDAAQLNPPGKIYIADLDPKSNKQGWTSGTGANTTIIDPWGNEYLYRKGNNARNPDFDLWSKGRDGKTNLGTSPAAINHRDNKDDLWN